MKAAALLLAFTFVAVPAALLAVASTSGYPEVEVVECQPPTFGYAVFVNGQPVMRCPYEAGA